MADSRDRAATNGATAMGREDIMGLVDATGSHRTSPTRGHRAVEKKVSATVLHKDTRDTLDLLQTSDAVAVTHYNEVEGYLVSPDRYSSLVESAARAEARDAEISSTLPLLLAAVRTGVPIPSETLERFLPAFNVAEHWRDVARFAATFPVTLNAGEHGEPIAKVHLSPGYGHIEDSGTDDELNLD